MINTINFNSWIPALRDCVAIGENSFKIVIPVKAGIQKLLKLLDSPVSSTGQALRRASLARNDKMVIATQSLRGNDR